VAAHKLGNQTEPWIWPVLSRVLGCIFQFRLGPGLTVNKSPGEPNSAGSGGVGRCVRPTVGERGGRWEAEYSGPRIKIIYETRVSDDGRGRKMEKKKQRPIARVYIHTLCGNNVHTIYTIITRRFKRAQ